MLVMGQGELLHGLYVTLVMVQEKYLKIVHFAMERGGFMILNRCNGILAEPVTAQEKYLKHAKLVMVKGDILIFLHVRLVAGKGTLSAISVREAG